MCPRRINCERPWCEIIEMAYETSDTEERKPIIAFFIRYGRSRLEMDIAELKEAVADDEVEE